MELRKATVADIHMAHKLIQYHASRGRMLPRPLAKLYEQIRDFAVLVEDEEVVAVGALHVLWHDLAEIRAVAVAPRAIGRGLGRAIVEFLVDEANDLGLKRVFILTYEPEFFGRCGFHRAAKAKLPQKIWQECVYCDKFGACDEIPMIRDLVPIEEIDDSSFPSLPPATAADLTYLQESA